MLQVPAIRALAATLAFSVAPLLVGAPRPAHAEVALLGGARARPLRGQFNQVPVLHSNQPEEVSGPGILIDTRPGAAIAAESGEPLANASFRFQGPFGLHLHHKYDAPAAELFVAPGRRRELHLAAVLINPGLRPVRIRFERGAVRNSFEAPYLGENLMGVKPLGPRPWNTGPGDATAVQMLRGRLDARLSPEIVLPPRERLVLFSTQLPALGVANALLRGSSDGPFEMAVVAAPPPGDAASVLATLDAGRLAPGRTYLAMLDQIHSGAVFSRVGGVALGDAYSARLSHDLDRSGPLHVPLTSTVRTEFGSGDVQVNPLVSRMADSSLDNVGTYGVRFDLDLDLRGAGGYALMLSHPRDPGGRVYTAFRGSIEITTAEGRRDVHVGMRSGESLRLADLHLEGGEPKAVRISLVYPADATPGHLLSVISDTQLAQFREQQRNLAEERRAPPRTPPPVQPPPPLPTSLTPQRPRPQGASAQIPATAAGRRGREARATAVSRASRSGQRAAIPPLQPLRPPRRLGAASVAAPLRPPASLSREVGARAGTPQLMPQPPRPMGRGTSLSAQRGDVGLVNGYRRAVEAQRLNMRYWPPD